MRFWKYLWDNKINLLDLSLLNVENTCANTRNNVENGDDSNCPSTVIYVTMSRNCDAPWTRVNSNTRDVIKVDDAMKRDGWRAKELLKQACLQGNMYLVKKILEQETVHNINLYFKYSCSVGNRDLVNLMIERSANNWNYGLNGACFGGHLDIANFMIDRGADNWNDGLKYACEGGHLDLAMLMIERGANYWNYLYYACRGGHRDLAMLMIDQGANDWKDGLFGACEGGHIDLVMRRAPAGIALFRMHVEGDTVIL